MEQSSGTQKLCEGEGSRQGTATSAAEAELEPRPGM